MAAAFGTAMIGPLKLGPVDYALVIESMVHVVMPLVLLVILWPVGMALVVVVIRGLVGMAVVMAVMAEVALMVMSVGKLEPLVMNEPEVLAVVKMEQLVMPLVVLLMAELEQPKVPDQPVRYLVYAIEWWYQHILQGNSFHLQWGNLSRYPHSLIL